METTQLKTFKVLILFSGTGSVEKGLNKLENINVEYRGLDMDNKFKPFYNVNILEWDYKNELKDWVPDYIHSSFVCCEFSNMKHGKVRNLELGYSLLNKSIEIFEYLKTINPKILITAENPRNKFVKEHEELNKYNRTLTHYCKYGFKYTKPTFIWSNIELELKKCSKKCGYCDFRKQHNYHEVMLGYRTNRPNQMTISKYVSKLKKEGKVKRGITDTYFKYRIPVLLIDSILKQIIKEFNKKQENDELQELTELIEIIEI